MLKLSMPTYLEHEGELVCKTAICAMLWVIVAYVIAFKILGYLVSLGY